ncbi:MAG: Asp23/Gls24 family envelope stress response protein [Clostridia bacterium]
MAVSTSNIFGKINISDFAIAMVANHVALECYGVFDLVSRKLTDSMIEFFNRAPSFAKGIKVEVIDNKINIDIYTVLIDGVSIDAVCDSLKSTVKYNVETFTGMRVNKVNVNVVGVKV